MPTSAAFRALLDKHQRCAAINNGYLIDINAIVKIVKFGHKKQKEIAKHQSKIDDLLKKIKASDDIDLRVEYINTVIGYDYSLNRLLQNVLLEIELKATPRELMSDYEKLFFQLENYKLQF